MGSPTVAGRQGPRPVPHLGSPSDSRAPSLQGPCSFQRARRHLLFFGFSYLHHPHACARPHTTGTHNSALFLCPRQQETEPEPGIGNILFSVYTAGPSRFSPGPILTTPAVSSWISPPRTPAFPLISLSSSCNLSCSSTSTSLHRSRNTRIGISNSPSLDACTASRKPLGDSFNLRPSHQRRTDGPL